MKYLFHTYRHSYLCHWRRYDWKLINLLLINFRPTQCLSAYQIFKAMIGICSFILLLYSFSPSRTTNIHFLISSFERSKNFENSPKKLQKDLLIDYSTCTALQLCKSYHYGVLNNFTTVLNAITEPSLLDYWSIKAINISFLNYQHNDEPLPWNIMMCIYPAAILKSQIDVY